MRVFLSDDYYCEQSFEISKFNHIIGGNGMGKTRLLNALKNGFESKTKDFLIDGLKVSKDDYTVYYIGDTDSLYNEKSFGTKSFLRKDLKNEIASIDENNLTCLKEKLNTLSDEIDGILSCVNIGDVRVNFEANILDLILKNTRISINDCPLEYLSYSRKRIEYIKMIVNIIDRYINPAVLLIDEPFINLSSKKSKELLDYLENNLKDINVIVFLASSSAHNECWNPIYVLKNEVKNVLVSDEDVYKLIAKVQNCSLDDAIYYTSIEELELYKNENLLIPELELKFVNTSENILNFSDFIKHIE